MKIKKFILNEIYIYYFLLSGTIIKFMPFYKIIDIIFLLIVPVIIISDKILKKKINKYDLERFGIIIIFLIQIFFRKNFLENLVYFLSNIVLYFIIFNWKNEIKIKTLKISLFINFIFVSFSLVMIYIGHSANGLFNNSVNFGMYCLLGIFLTRSIFYKKKIGIMFIMFYIYTLIITNTRGTILALIIFFLFQEKLQLKKILKNLLYCVVTILLLGVFNIVNFEKIINKYNYKKFNLTTGRDIIWKESIKIFQDTTNLGEGIGHYDLIKSLEKKMLSPNVHNSYLDIILSLGIFLGIIVLIDIFKYYLKIVYLNKNIIGKDKLKFAILTSILIYSCTESLLFFTRNPLSLIFWKYLGELSYKLRKERKQNEISIYDSSS